MSFEKKLLQMKGLLNKEQPKRKSPPQKRQRPAHEEEWRKIGLELIENKFGFVYRKKQFYPENTVHGNVPIAELDRVLEAWPASEAEHPFRLSGKDRLVFFDTETTGLSGTGAFIFLTGVLKRTTDGFELVQLVMPDPGNEAAFLYETGLWKDPAAVIFSYNGKSFDWPQLMSRWTLHRNVLPPLPEPKHVDLLHGTKRIWKDELERLKLSTIEEEKLGLIRRGDVPGHLIPPIYLDAVKNGYPDALSKVLYHNELDILSLVALYIVASDLLLDDFSSETSGTYTNIGKWYSDLKQFEKSADYLEHVTKERGLAAARARFLLAVQRKRAGNYEDALRLFREAAPNLRGPLEVDAWVHAAKLCEHQMGDLEQALIMTGFAKEAADHVKVRESLKADIRKREARLLTKRQKNRQGTQDDRHAE